MKGSILVIEGLCVGGQLHLEATLEARMVLLKAQDSILDGPATGGNLLDLGLSRLLEAGQSSLEEMEDVFEIRD